VSFLNEISSSREIFNIDGTESLSWGKANEHERYADEIVDTSLVL
jgi:hypothetical protein